MIGVLNPNLIVRILCVVIFGIEVVDLWAREPATARSVWHARALVVLALDVLIALLTSDPIFHFIHQITFAKYWLFPRLDGKWTGTIDSNWTRIAAMKNAACGLKPPFDVDTDPLPPLTSIPVKVSIKIGLFQSEIKTEITGSRVSTSVFVKPEWKKPAPPKLYYMFEQREDYFPSIAQGEGEHHEGAAYLVYDTDRDTLSGPYWTRRSWEKGLNTAGGLYLKRVA